MNESVFPRQGKTHTILSWSYENMQNKIRKGKFYTSEMRHCAVEIRAIKQNTRIGHGWQNIWVNGEFLTKKLVKSVDNFISCDEDDFHGDLFRWPTFCCDQNYWTMICSSSPCKKRQLSISHGSVWYFSHFTLFFLLVRRFVHHLLFIVCSNNNSTKKSI